MCSAYTSVLQEAELKAKLGYNTQHRGHQQWPELRSRLEASGCLQASVPVNDMLPNRSKLCVTAMLQSRAEHCK